MLSSSTSFAIDAKSRLQQKDCARSLDVDNLRHAQVEQVLATEVPPLVLNCRQRSAPCFGGYLHHRVLTTGNLCKSWKRTFFRLWDNRLVCYKTPEALSPLFEAYFTTDTVLVAHTCCPNLPYPTLKSFAFLLQHVEIRELPKTTPAHVDHISFQAINEVDLKAWMQWLTHAIDARKLQLDGLTSQATSDPKNVNVSDPRCNFSAVRSSRVQVETYQAFLAKYLLMKEIGEGSFAIVHRAVNRTTGQVCAVKCCKRTRNLELEEELLQTFAHPNVVRLEGVYERDTSLHYVVMDYLKDGDLCDLLLDQQRLPEREARRILRQVLHGLAYLHRRYIIHRDIKPENILVHGTMVKLADFGLAKELTHATTRLTRRCGTLEYAAPEVLCGRSYGIKSDVFSLGIVLFVVLFGAFPFRMDSAAALPCQDQEPIGVDRRDMSCLSKYNVQWRLVSPLAQDVLLKMLAVNETDRISAHELLDHPWFNETEDGRVNPTADELELARLEDCEAMGFAELLSRGFQVVKYGLKDATKPHPTVLRLNFMEECITWTARPKSMQEKHSTSSKSGEKRRRISLRDIAAIQTGHSTQILQGIKPTTSIPPSDLCLSIICQWRTLDLVVQVPSQREFMVRGFRRLLAE